MRYFVIHTPYMTLHTKAEGMQFSGENAVLELFLDGKTIAVFKTWDSIHEITEEKYNEIALANSSKINQNQNTQEI